MATKAIEINISKYIEDLKGIDDVLYDPRSWSPDDLREACNNVRFDIDNEIESIELAALQFVFRHLFFLLHQTGLYNPQRKLWSLIAQAHRVRMASCGGIRRKDREHTKITDLLIEDISSKFIQVRIVHPGSELEYPRFNNLLGNISGKCLGLIYISDQDPSDKVMNKVRRRTNADDFFDKYRSPIAKNCSLNLVKYELMRDKYNFSLIYPSLGKNVGAELCLVHS